MSGLGLILQFRIEGSWIAPSPLTGASMKRKGRANQKKTKGERTCACGFGVESSLTLPGMLRPDSNGHHARGMRWGWG